MKSINYISVTAFLNKLISKQILLSLNVSKKGNYEQLCWNSKMKTRPETAFALYDITKDFN